MTLEELKEELTLDATYATWDALGSGALIVVVGLCILAFFLHWF